MKRILCFGDSNTWGYVADGNGARFDEETRWTQVMAKRLGPAYTVIEEGLNGRTTVFYDPVEDRMAGIDYFPSCVESHAPLDLLILMLGTNDLKTRFSANARDIADGFDRYLNALRAGNIHGAPEHVLLVSPIEMDESYREHPLFSKIFGDDAVARSGELAASFRSFAEERGLHFLNAAEFAKASPRDGLHLDAASHIRLGEEMARKALEILGG